MMKLYQAIIRSFNEHNRCLKVNHSEGSRIALEKLDGYLKLLTENSELIVDVGIDVIHTSKYKLILLLKYRDDRNREKECDIAVTNTLADGFDVQTIPRFAITSMDDLHDRVLITLSDRLTRDVAG